MNSSQNTASRTDNDSLQVLCPIGGLESNGFIEWVRPTGSLFGRRANYAYESCALVRPATISTPISLHKLATFVIHSTSSGNFLASAVLCTLTLPQKES